jgi:trehalose 6-phosphate synthase/phosphatase
MQELRDTLVNLTETMDVGVFEGNRILEIRRLGISKGRAVERLIAQGGWDFLLAAGDDYTDEEMFAFYRPARTPSKWYKAPSRPASTWILFNDLRSIPKKPLNAHAISPPA